VKIYNKFFFFASETNTFHISYVESKKSGALVGRLKISPVLFCCPATNTANKTISTLHSTKFIHFLPCTAVKTIEKSMKI
jgi:hypothetical protein